MEISVAIRQLMERGSLPAKVLPCSESSEIVPDPTTPGNVMLRSERDLMARIDAAGALHCGVGWDKLSVPERLLFRQQFERLKLKRLQCGSVYKRGKYGARCRRELLAAISAAKGGIDCFELFAEYPKAHDDVLSLIQLGKVVTVATAVWAPTRT